MLAEIDGTEDTSRGHEDMDDILQQLVCVREMRNISQTTLGKRLGWSQTKVSKFESKPHDKLKFGDLRQYANALGLRLIINLGEA